MSLLLALAPLWAGGAGEAPQARAGGTLAIGTAPPIERGPFIVPYFLKAVAGASSDLQGVNLAFHWPRTRFRDAWREGR